MTTYIAFQAFYTDNEITEEWVKDWKIDNAYIRKRRHDALRRFTR